LTDTSPKSGRIDTRVDERSGGRLAWVTINHPTRLNSMGRELMRELAAALQRLGDDASLSAAVVTGAGDRAFIGGADIREMAEIANPAAARDFIGHVHAACAAARALPVPVIARIDGYCFGAGLEFAAACDLRIASADATFGMPEVRLGIPSVVEAALLPGLIGWGRTRRLLFTGETIAADQALAWGLVEEVVPVAELDAALEVLLADIFACGPDAIRAQKALIRAWESLSPEAAIAAGIDAFAAAYEGEEPRAMMARFLEAQAARKAGRSG
jgi:enoyl-CoA hydratase